LSRSNPEEEKKRSAIDEDRRGSAGKEREPYKMPWEATGASERGGEAPEAAEIEPELARRKVPVREDLRNVDIGAGPGEGAEMYRDTSPLRDKDVEAEIAESRTGSERGASTRKQGEGTRSRPIVPGTFGGGTGIQYSDTEKGREGYAEGAGVRGEAEEYELRGEAEVGEGAGAEAKGVGEKAKAGTRSTIERITAGVRATGERVSGTAKEEGTETVRQDLRSIGQGMKGNLAGIAEALKGSIADTRKEIREIQKGPLQPEAGGDESDRDMPTAETRKEPPRGGGESRPKEPSE